MPAVIQTKLFSVYKPEPRIKVLILGGSGYLGQFLSQGLNKDYVVVSKSSQDVNFLASAEVVREQLNEERDCSVIINCAAISQ